MVRNTSPTANPPAIGRVRVTAKDLAVRLGVATSTVSRAFDSGSRISDDLRQRIISLADEMGYRPNAIARSLNQQRSGIVALVMGDMANPFYPEALEEFSLRLQQAHRQLLLFVVPKGGEADDVMPQVLQYQVDAIVVTAAKLSSRTSELCARQGIPVVFMNRRVDDPMVWSVCCNNESMGVMVAEYLVKKDRKVCAFIAGDMNISTTVDRLRGFERGLAANGQKLLANVQGGYTYDGGFAAAGELFAKGKPLVDAVFCANDIMALGVLGYLRQNTSLDVPKDVAVVGFDDIRAASYPEYNLTTVRQPVGEMIDLAIGLLRTGHRPGSIHAVLQEVPGQLILRGSA
ncbi:LacI family DNA-binding transcriptional regulator [Noviherbaspirillum saxi]|uniref:LacI family DNA-binding transcriptional regulator n=1 Tax=Noviherbaspirillum saxi TaxID=2320863 RepID=A0A3A3FKJ3_9BURK|nr:LacI family DNA-binding transcriptional regulator [Noviherbaspirillum saxi]RJF91855.1 LacI family DNA-binding transcriptional regulator [Noviherbaspirillum saxi]